ncbi:MAG: hypothetical protein WAT70_05855 [Rhizobiaceae bacterium]
MPSSPLRRRYLPGIVALHWSATFALFSGAAISWRPDGQGASLMALVDPLLKGPLANVNAAFALSTLFALIALSFAWTALAAFSDSPDADDVSAIAGIAAIIGVSLTGIFASLAGSPLAIAMSTGLVAAIFASMALRSRSSAAVAADGPSPASLMAAGAAETVALVRISGRHGRTSQPRQRPDGKAR